MNRGEKAEPNTKCHPRGPMNDVENRTTRKDNNK